MCWVINYQYDLASNATARKADDLAKLNTTNWASSGYWFQFFFCFYLSGNQGQQRLLMSITGSDISTQLNRQAPSR